MERPAHLARTLGLDDLLGHLRCRPRSGPYNASNAAVPLAAVILGHLPQTDGDRALVKALGMTVFLLAFVPLIFGGTVYRMLEKIMTAKLVLVLGYLSLIGVTMVSWPVVRDVWTGFVRVGTVPLRAQTIILERDFTIEQAVGGSIYRARGTWEKDGKPTGEFSVTTGPKTARFDLRKSDVLTPELKEMHDRLLGSVLKLAAPQKFSSRPRQTAPRSLHQAKFRTTTSGKRRVSRCKIRPARMISATFPWYPSQKRSQLSQPAHAC